jgi:hypothetical protein
MLLHSLQLPGQTTASLFRTDRPAEQFTIPNRPANWMQYPLSIDRPMGCFTTHNRLAEHILVFNRSASPLQTDRPIV